MRKKAAACKNKQETIEIVGCVEYDSLLSYYVDIGTVAARRLWIPKRVVIKKRRDKKYKEMFTFTIPLWFAKREGLLDAKSRHRR